jgi:arylsulfatase A-like enzyme
LGLILSLCTGQDLHGQATKPNIIFIMTDDQDASTLSFMPQVQTHLVQQGTTLSNHIITTPICGPSRSSLLRGQFAHNHGVLITDVPLGGWDTFRALGHEESTIATWMQAAGYATTFMGKYINGYGLVNDLTHVPPGWTEWYGEVPYSTTGGRYTNFDLNENGLLVSYRGNDTENYEADVLQVKALDFIHRQSGANQPFFLFINPYASHGNPVSAKRHETLFGGLQAPRTPSFNEADISDKGTVINQDPLLTEADIADIDSTYRERLRTLQAVDELIEGLVTTLAQEGILDNTYLFYATDNGYHLGQHRQQPGKRMPYEEDIRFPLIVRGPGVAAGQTLEHLVMNIDLAPTFAELAGIIPADFVDGRSLMPVLNGQVPVEQWRKVVLIEDWTTEAQNPDILEARFRAVRTATQKYIDWQRFGDEEAYDLTADLYELESIHASLSADERTAFVSMLDALYSCAGATCRAADGAIVAVEEVPPSPSTSLFLYPNPARDRFTLQWTVSTGGGIRIELYDVLGRRVRMLEEAILPAGQHTRSYATTGLPPGRYLVRALLPDQTLSRSLMVIP